MFERRKYSVVLGGVGGACCCCCWVVVVGQTCGVWVLFRISFGFLLVVCVGVFGVELWPYGVLGIVVFCALWFTIRLTALLDLC